MTGAEKGFLLLSSSLGDPDRRVLTTAQLRKLGQRARLLRPGEDRELTVQDLTGIGCTVPEVERILGLLSDADVLERYLAKGRRLGVQPITRLHRLYPARLRQRLELECPGVLWAKGDLSILDSPMISLVGSRNISPANARFAREAGRQAALQGYALVSGNARGADSIAQQACLEAGGKIVCVLADALARQRQQKNVLFLSLDDFDGEFSAMRALSRNRVIHALGSKVLVAQCTAGKGGTWDGTVKNLRSGWSPIFCFHDGSPGCDQLICLGAEPVNMEMLNNLSDLQPSFSSFLDR